MKPVCPLFFSRMCHHLLASESGIARTRCHTGIPFLSLHAFMVVIIIHALRQHFNIAEHCAQALQTDEAQIAGTPQIAPVIRDPLSKSAIASRSMATNLRTHDSMEYSSRVCSA